jgi:hypothetical protein
MLRRQLSANRARSRSRAVRAACVTLFAAFAGGCATTTDLGRTERLPEGTLPPSKEVGPPVNIQPAPLARDEYRGVPRHPWVYGPAYGPAYGPTYGPGWYGPRCFDPLIPMLVHPEARMPLAVYTYAVFKPQGEQAARRRAVPVRHPGRQGLERRRRQRRQ